MNIFQAILTALIVNGAFTDINFLVCSDTLKVFHDGIFWKSCNFTALPATDQISYDMS